MNAMRDAHDLLFAQILDNIHQNLYQEVTLKELAESSFVSVNYLCRIFKDRTGTTVKKYMSTRRITYAKQRLLEGASVKEACCLSGYSDYAHFIRTFSKIVGLPPKLYAKRMGGLPSNGYCADQTA